VHYAQRDDDDCQLRTHAARRGREDGLDLGRRALDLTFSSEYLRVAVEVPSALDVPLSARRRREWLLGFADGILRALAELPGGL
jgi:hypothetical protein